MTALSERELRRWYWDLVLADIKFDPNQRRDRDGRWTDENLAPALLEEREEALENAEQVGGEFFHGTSGGIDRFGSGLAFLAPEPDESRPFAEGFGLDSSASGRIVRVTAKRGPSRDVSADVEDAIIEGDDPDEAVRAAAEEARLEGYRYVTFSHPSVFGGKDFRAVISLFPDEDLVIEGEA